MGHSLVLKACYYYETEKCLALEVQNKHSHLIEEENPAIALLLSRLTFVIVVSSRCMPVVAFGKKGFEYKIN